MLLTSNIWFLALCKETGEISVLLESDQKLMEVIKLLIPL